MGVILYQDPVRTIHTLLSRFLGTLELAQDHSFDYYSGDKVVFNIEYWKDLLTVYTEDDRHFLGQDTGLFLILRFVLQTLSQARLARMPADSKLTIIENQVNRLHDSFLIEKFRLQLTFKLLKEKLCKVNN